MIKTMAVCKTEHLMAMFDVAREHHRTCKDVWHYVRIFRERIFIGHEKSEYKINSCSLLTVKLIHGTNMTEPQRAALKIHILKELEA